MIGVQIKEIRDIQEDEGPPKPGVLDPYSPTSLPACQHLSHKAEDMRTSVRVFRGEN